MITCKKRMYDEQSQSKGATKNMKLFRFYYKQHAEEKIGLSWNDQLIDLNRVAENWGFSFPATLTELICSRETDLYYLQEQFHTRSVEDYQNCVVSEKMIRFLPVVEKPEKIICTGFNYPQHAVEYDGDIPTDPIWFNKFSNTLSAHQ